MKVRDLIIELQSQDLDAEVLVWDPFNDTETDVIEVVEGQYYKPSILIQAKG